jgi:transcriptional regulator GlxA family with amidase domain
VFGGFDELDATFPFEVLKRAASGDASVEVKLVTLDGAEEVAAVHGLRDRSDGKLGEGRDGAPDMLVVPGRGWAARAPWGVQAEVERGELLTAIARLHEGGVMVASVCTGAMLLAAAGLTRGRPATTNHVALEALGDTGAEVVEARVVGYGSLATSGGVTSGLDLALWLVERYFGVQAASAMESALEHERRGVVWRRREEIKEEVRS